MTVNKHLMPIIVGVALLGTVAVAMFTGAWVSTGKALVDANNLKAADLRGWMTLQQAADGLKLPLDVIYKLAGVPDGANITPETPLKALEGVVSGFDVSALRDAVAAYQANGSLPPSKGGAAPSAPVAPTPNAAAAPTATAVHAPKSAGEESRPTPLPAGQLLPASQIKGTMTFRDVSEQCAVPLDKLLASVKLPANTSPDTQLKALASEEKMEVQVIRDAVAELQKQK